MKIVTTNLLNRFWKNGVKPIKDGLANKVDSSKIVNSLLTTAEGFALDARQGKVLDNKITELNRKSIKRKTISGTTTRFSNLTTDLSINKYNVLSAYSTNEVSICLPYISTSLGVWALHVRGTDNVNLFPDTPISAVVIYNEL